MTKINYDEIYLEVQSVDGNALLSFRGKKIFTLTSSYLDRQMRKTVTGSMCDFICFRLLFEGEMLYLNNTDVESIARDTFFNLNEVNIVKVYRKKDLLKINEKFKEEVRFTLSACDSVKKHLLKFLGVNLTYFKNELTGA